MKILAFGASTSSSSINRQLANHAASRISDAEVNELDLRQFDLPVYSADEEESNGIPADAQAFKDMISNHDGVVLSMAEHNGSYSAAFKKPLTILPPMIREFLWACSEKPCAVSPSDTRYNGKGMG